MKGFINVHCHIINFRFVPDSFFRTRAPIREKLLRRRFTAWLAHLVTWILPGSKYDRLHEILTIYQKSVSQVTDILIKEMDEANIAVATPLMMDLEFASFNEKPEIPYRHQIELTATAAAKYPGRLLPFVMVDARRPRAAETTITALEELGFLGVKMYPPLGCHPYHKAFYNESITNRELAEIYEYCEAEKIPMTIHCSPGGAYSSEIMQAPEIRYELTKPASWRPVLDDFPQLRLNLAHFGGAQDLLKIENPDSWAHEIRDMLGEFDHVYTDLAYHDLPLKGEAAPYFEVLSQVLDDDRIKHKVMFGTDWSMTRHTWTEAEYIVPFVEYLGAERMDLIAVRNPLKFLFPDDKIPDRITKALARRGERIPKDLFVFEEPA